jgi:tRNA/tmRNA/rRNA uracil-C5-methylase (TrmA/RlmC/RlmD family)
MTNNSNIKNTNNIDNTNNNKNINKKSNNRYYKKEKIVLNTESYFPKNVSNEVNKKLLFPETKNIKNMDKLRITNIGLYSITKPKDADWISNKILEYVKNGKEMTITDATSAIGGNSISFAKHFKNVNSIEMNPLHFEMLKNNIGVYGYNNVKFYLGDSVKVLKDTKQDIVFFDPPWGGPNYKKIKHLKLNLSKVPLSIIVNDLLKGDTKYIVIRTPINFDYNSLFNFVKSDSYKIYITKSWHLIIIENTKNLK